MPTEIEIYNIIESYAQTLFWCGYWEGLMEANQETDGEIDDWEEQRELEREIDDWEEQRELERKEVKQLIEFFMEILVSRQEWHEAFKERLKLIAGDEINRPMVCEKDAD